MTLCSKITYEKVSNCVDENAYNIQTLMEKCEEKITSIKKEKESKLDQALITGPPTFKSLHQHLLHNSYDTIHDMIQAYQFGVVQKRFEPQESLFRFFALLNLFDHVVIEDLTLSLDFYISQANFSKGLVQQRAKLVNNEASFQKFMETKLKDKGDISDLTFVSKHSSQPMLVCCSSKNFASTKSLFDLDQIWHIYRSTPLYKNMFRLKTVLVVPSKVELNKVINRMKSSSSVMKSYLEDSIKIDWDDLQSAYRKYKAHFAAQPELAIFPTKDKPYLGLYLNQQYSVNKAISIMKKGKNQRILLGQKPRSGKTFIMGGIIAQDRMVKTKHVKMYVIITTVPSETKTQYIDDLFSKYKEFHDMHIVDLTRSTVQSKIPQNEDVVVVVSKQFLGFDTDVKYNFFKTKHEKRIIMFDEVHFSGTTDKSKQMLIDYSLNNSHTIYVTATYDKPIQAYNIPIDNFILWDLDDEKMCKTLHFDTETKKTRLFEKHGPEFERVFNQYTINQVVKQYEKAPDIKMYVMDIKPDIKDLIKDKVGDSEIQPGFSMEALFTTTTTDCTTDCVFKYNHSVTQFVKMIFGSSGLFDQIDEFCKINSSRRFTYDNPLSVMMFLPEINGNPHNHALRKVINTITKDFKVVIINNANDKENKAEHDTGNAKYVIQNAIKTIIETNKNPRKQKNKGVIALIGKQASIGVTINTCDVVVLADGGLDNKDMTQQRMFRCGSDAVGKRFGFIIEASPLRALEYIAKIGNNIKMSQFEETTKDGIRYVVESNLIEFANDDWLRNIYDINTLDDNALINLIYKKYLQRQNIKRILQHIEVDYTSESFLQFASSVSDISKGLGKAQSTIKAELSKGIKHIGVESDNKSTESISSSKEYTKATDEISIEEKLKRLNEILNYLLPLVVLFTSSREKFRSLSSAFHYIKVNKNPLYQTFLTEVKDAWFPSDKTTHEEIESTVVKFFEHVDNNQSGMLDAARDLKELFLNTKNDIPKLYEEINNHIGITESNKQKNADIITPEHLVEEMLDKLPAEVWTDLDKKWLDPAAGRGAFMVCIYKRLMKSLSNKIVDKEIRQKHIIQNMLFMSEINPLNCEILRLIFGENINLYNGDTLELAKSGDNNQRGDKKIKIKYPLFTVELVMDENYNLVNVHQTKESELDIDNERLVDAFLKMKLQTPNRKKTKSNGEVFTPQILINEMLDKLPTDVWTNSELKWFDPAVGTGQFMIIVYRRLMKGLQSDIPDEAERKNHIIKNMLFMSELDEQNYTECEKIFGNDCNIFKGNTLDSSNDEFKFAQQFGFSKFDVIVGNPPYNQGKKIIYNLFTEALIDKCKYFLFIIPSIWLVGNKGMDNFRYMMLNRRDLRIIKHYDNIGDAFPGISMEGGVMYFFKDSLYNGDVEFNGQQLNFGKHDVFVTPGYDDLISKFKNMITLDTIMKPRSYTGISTNDPKLSTKKCDDCYSVYVSRKMGKNKNVHKSNSSNDSLPPLMYIKKKDVNPKDFSQWKVVTPRANGGNGCFGRLFIGEPYHLTNDSFVFFETASENEAKSLITYLTTKLPNVMLSLRKISQDIIPRTVSWIPLVPLDRTWSDEKVYKYFQLTQEQIEKIQNTQVKGYDKLLAKNQNRQQR